MVFFHAVSNQLTDMLDKHLSLSALHRQSLLLNLPFVSLPFSFVLDTTTYTHVHDLLHKLI